MGQRVDADTAVFRFNVCQTFMSNGIPLSKVDGLRLILEVTRASR